MKIFLKYFLTRWKMFISKFCHSNEKSTVDRLTIVSFSYQLAYKYMHALTNLQETFFDLHYIINRFFVISLLARGVPNVATTNLFKQIPSIEAFLYGAG